ncbi:hypothetical protein F2P81_016923 [Scophthalmus maximus]|uniref:Uncharacterized protein n=1 Tax=Scophthalmus maximus TaxID=52904 RepID=A0A6A4SIL7_SCOMX|nr:hypothetical protein F2P81_016923 [Scophthalmus maximus]
MADEAALTDPGPNGGSDRSLEQACAWQTDTVAMQIYVYIHIKRLHPTWPKQSRIGRVCWFTVKDAECEIGMGHMMCSVSEA